MEENINEQQILVNMILVEEYQDYFNELSDKYFNSMILKRLFNNAYELYITKQLNIDNILTKYKNNEEYEEVNNMLVWLNPMSAKTIEYDINLLKENYKKQSLRSLLVNSVNDISKKPINDVLSDLNYKISKLDVQDKKELKKANMALTELFGEIEDIKENKKIKYPTGIRELDTLTGGLKGSEMTIIAGRPGTGKTTFALNIACNIARKSEISPNKNVLYICLEMSTNQLVSKVLSYESYVNSQIIYNGVWNKEEFSQINKSVNLINDNYKLTFSTKFRYLEDMIYEIKRLKAKDEVDVVIVDYLSLVQVKSKVNSVREKIIKISRDFKLLSLELDIPIILLSQLNRDAQEKEPTIANLSESSSVEMDADNIILLHTEEEERTKTVPIVKVKLAKQRGGATGSFETKFNKSKNRFSCIEK